MNRVCGHRGAVTAMGVGALLVGDRVASACSVCFGDPDSDMAKGAAAGVLSLAVIIGCMLLGIAGTGVLWLHRSRQLGTSTERDLD